MKNHINKKTGAPFPRGLKPTTPAVKAKAAKYHPKLKFPASYFRLPKRLSYWLNNQYGVCVTSQEAFNKACAGIWIEDATVKTWAQQHDVLDGANLKPVIDDMVERGFAQNGNLYNDGNGLLVDHSNHDMLRHAVYDAGMAGGCVDIGISADMLPEDAGNENGWFLAGPTNDSNEDHCTGLCGYGTAAQFCAAMKQAFGINLTVPGNISATAQGFAHFTWNTIGWVEERSQVGMMGEAWIRKPGSITVGSGQPTKVEVYVTEDPTPNPDPVPPVDPGWLVMIVDTIFMGIEATLIGKPIVLALVKFVHRFVIQWLTDHPLFTERLTNAIQAEMDE